jgi:hypothetical protein
MARHESSPLLSKHNKKSKKSYNGSSSSSNSSSDSDNEVIGVLTSNPPTLEVIVSKSGDTTEDEADALLKRRLNGASIYAVFFG